METLENLVTDVERDLLEYFTLAVLKQSRRYSEKSLM